MLLLLFLLSVSSECGAQLYMYGGPVPYRRAPVRRSPMEALERLRAPVARYYPQVDYPEEYRGAYALPPQWTDAAPLYNDEGNDEEEYEYEAPLSPVYRTPVETYQEEAAMPRDLVSYGELMRSYLMPPPEQPLFMQRRSDSAPAPPPPTSTQEPRQTDATTPPPPPEKKSVVQSLVLPDPVPPQSSAPGDEGQKEEPLFRPLHNSQRTTDWNDAQRKPQQQSPIPMLKQMIQGMQEKKSAADPLLEELSSLKKV